MENKKNNAKKRKMSKQTILTIGMIMVSIFVITVASYAWYLISNTPKITNAEFVADTVGNLKIANENDQKNGPSGYMDAIDMYDGLNKDDHRLSPVTTKDGKNFFKPIYTEGTITGLEAVPDDEYRTKDYIFEKVFYLKAGDDNGAVNNAPKYYDIKLVGMSSAEKTRYGTNSVNYKTDYEINYADTDYKYIGSFMHDKLENASNLNAPTTAANALRISYEFIDAEGSKTVIYEPNCDKTNTVSTDDYLQFTGANSENYGTYTGLKELKQNANKSFENPGTDVASDAFAIIEEGKDVKVTMRVWIEGTDVDCRNGIAADKIFGQIQFVSEENKEFPTP